MTLSFLTKLIYIQILILVKLTVKTLVRTLLVVDQLGKKGQCHDGIY